MNKIFCIFAAVSAAVCSSFADMVTHEIEGEVKETCVAAVGLHPFLYSEATKGRENALASELRIYEDGTAVPYVIRRQMIRKQVERSCQHTLRVTKVDEKDGLLIEAELPKTDRKDSRFSRLQINTPLTDFEQVVTVKVGDEVKAAGAICDYSRYASFRRTEIPVSLPSSGTLRLAFARPVSEVEAAQFERTISENSSGVEAKSIRRAVQERPFRIDSIRVVETWHEFVFEPAPAWDLETRAEIVRNAETKTTTLDFETYGRPLSAVGINTKDENFSRTARVLVRRNGGWVRIADGRIKVVNLPGKKEKSLEISLGREVRERVMRIELDDGDNPPVSFEKLAVSGKIVPYDAAFIAKPGKKYELRIEQGADLPRYDQVVREYIAEVKDPVRLDYKVTAEFGGDGPTATWLTWNPIPTISLVVFVLLAVVCFWLFKSTGKN